MVGAESETSWEGSLRFQDLGRAAGVTKSWPHRPGITTGHLAPTLTSISECKKSFLNAWENGGDPSVGRGLPEERPLLLCPSLASGSLSAGMK